MVLDPQTWNRWWVRSGVRGESRVRLFCFPMAGSAASLFGTWASLLPPGVELYALQMPGRENRLREPAIRNLAEATTGIVAALNALNLDDKLPAVFFGYSLGGLLAYETARALIAAGKPLPRRLLIAAAPAPQCDRSHIKEIHALPDAELIEQLRGLQGTPEAILRNAELMALLLPIIRADFEMLERHRHVPGPPLPLPLAAFGGIDDADVRPDELAEWSAQTSSEFTLRFLPGDHFFIKSAQEQLLAEISRLLGV